VRNAAGEIVRYADSVTELTDQLVDLATHPEHRRKHGADGRQLVETSFSWEALTAELETLLAGLEQVPESSAGMEVYE